MQIEFLGLNYFESKERGCRTIMFTIDSVKFHKVISKTKSANYKHILQIGTRYFSIVFYAPTWIYTTDLHSIIWNRACGKVRAKRYKHLYEKKTDYEKIKYLQMIMDKVGCYLLEIKDYNGIV